MPKYHPRLVDVPAVKHRYIYRHGYLLPFPPEGCSDEVLLAFARALTAPDVNGPQEDYFALLPDDRIEANTDTDEPQIMFYPQPWDADQGVPNPTRSRVPAAYGVDWPPPEDPWTG